MSRLLAIRKKIFKAMAKSAPGNVIRLWLLRLCTYRIGQNVYIGEEILVVDDLSDDKATLLIEDRVSVAPRVTFILYSAPNQSRIRPYVNERKGSIVVRHDAWIGTGAVIMPEVEVGEGAIVGANAVVTKSVRAYTVMVGIPAKAVGVVNMPWRQKENGTSSEAGGGES